jgi:hypothetical protein
MHKIWMVVDPPRRCSWRWSGVMAVAGALIHFVVLSSPRYCDHLGWCATSPTFTPGQSPSGLGGRRRCRSAAVRLGEAGTTGPRPTDRGSRPAAGAWPC